jgi:hypothetical protein
MKTPKPLPIISDADKAAAEAQILEQSKRIDFYLTEYSVEILANKMRDGEFRVPAYQREFVWEHDRKSRFIESVMMGLPIPFLFFWEMGDGRLEIVDGSQRLRTIQEFVLGDLRLGELESLPAVSNFRFSDLLESRQRKIRNRSIRGIVLNEHADDQARFDMFERINTGSKVAEKAEVRRGALAGPFMALVIDLATLPAFTALAPISDKLKKQREHEELVTRFFAYGDGLGSYKDRPSEFLFNYAKKMNTAFEAKPQLAAEYRRRFVDMVDFVSATFPNGFRRIPKGSATPRARFEAIALGSYLALGANPQIRSSVPNVAGWIEGEEFATITGSDGANAIGRLQRRMNFVRDRLLGT